MNTEICNNDNYRERGHGLKGTLAGFGGNKEKGEMMELYFNWENIGVRRLQVNPKYLSHLSH